MSGSVAAIKVRDIIKLLLAIDFNVVVVPTKQSQHFLNIEEYRISELLTEYLPDFSRESQA